MSTESRRGESRRGGRGKRAADWADGRLGVYGLAKTVMRTAFPDHWSFMIGEICLYSFLILVVTGVFLSLYFHPSMNEVVYHGRYTPLHGQIMSEAFRSTLHISFDVRGGLLIRQAHHWATLIFIAGIFVHMLRVFFTGAFRKPRELNWVFGFLLLILAMFEGLTGYDLGDDQLSGTGLAVVNGAILSVPVVGTYASMFIFGGEFPGTELVARFNTVHILLIPGLMVGLIAAHMGLALYHGHTQYPGPGRTSRIAVGMSVWVYAAKSTGFLFLLSGIIFTIASIAQINPIWQYGPFRPDQAFAGSQPDWYMGVVDGLLRIMPGWEINVLGHTLALDNFIPLLAAAVLFLSLGAYPFIESWVTDDDRGHHLIDRARNRPVRTGLGAAWMSAYLVALLCSSNDLIATHFHVSLNSVTWASRVGLFAIPLLVYVVTKRCAMGLQLRDRHKVLHGREAGVIRRLSHGEYIEVHEPLSRAELHTLTSHDQYAPFGTGQEGGEGGPDGKPGRMQRMRVRLSRIFYGQGAQIPKATVEEYKEINTER
ncbi:cytochrome bc complex cytochrome b subunit [Streptomyces sp. TS71-3]|uniref:cytochrome bc1 complex cytochrome b subunit n=1 Tax=Streptomyces sp. TS71-3 TaxID=2733862 RepID=UPI001B017259|nr:cytochrome bc complex cytochrome b subunit [Streptomyces sp. TS71-3]GHJ37369.1 menaquinol-cytochrome c reductase cytochrome b subunit [Streptomyces sp. TS71-3]